MAQLAAKLREWAPRQGDRVQVRVQDAPEARQAVERLALPRGVALEIVEQPAERMEARVPGADTLDPMSLLQQYFALRDKADKDDAASPAADNATRLAAQTVLQVTHAPCTLHPAPCTLHPKPCTLHPAPYTLNPAPYTLHPTPYTLHPAPCTLHPTPYALHPAPYTLNPTPYALRPTPLP